MLRSSHRQRHSLLFSAGILLLLGILNGCSQDDGIRQYTVEKIPSKERAAARPAVSESAQPAWFVKISGPTDAVLAQIVPFSRLVKSMSFDLRGNPQFELPTGWAASNGPPPRYQTFAIEGSDPPLEVAVSSLPGPSSAFDQYLLSNINRWRGQLQLPAYSGENWLDDARSNGELMIMPINSRLLAMVNLVGKTGEDAATRTLAAVILSPPGDPAAEGPEESAAVPVRPPFEFQVPAGWVESAGNAMRLASFEAKHDSGVADVSVSRFPGGGDEQSNINRWRQQVKLEPLTGDALKESLQELEIGGKAATYIQAVGPEQTILAAIVPDGDAKWFFKMQGPREVVAAETGHFEEFLKSVKFEK